MWGTQCFLQGTYCTGNGRETLDHWVPKSKGGRDTVWNLRPSCSECNAEKGNMSPEQWARQTLQTFTEGLPPAVRTPLPKPSGKYEFATLSELNRHLEALRNTSLAD